jgi:hypothetical protein
MDLESYDSMDYRDECALLTPPVGYRDQVVARDWAIRTDGASREVGKGINFSCVDPFHLRNEGVDFLGMGTHFGEIQGVGENADFNFLPGAEVATICGKSGDAVGQADRPLEASILMTGAPGH